MKLELPEIKRIVNTTIRTFLAYTEAHRTVGAKNLDFSQNKKGLSDLSDSMGVGLPFSRTVFDIGDLAANAEALSQQALKDADYKKYERTIQTLISVNKLKVEEGSVEYMILSREFLKALHLGATVESRRNRGDYSDDVEALFPIPQDRPIASGSSETPVPESEFILLNDLWEDYKAEKIRAKKWRKGVVRNHEPKFRSLLQFVGNVPIHMISKPMMRDYRKLLDVLPPYFSCKKEYKDIHGIEPKDIEGKHKETLDVTTIREYMNLARALFRYAVDNDYIEQNPVLTGMIPPKKQNARGQRDTFTDPDDLNRIFDPDLFFKWSETRNDQGIMRAERFWVPVLLLFTGCRLEEICQLETADVSQLEGLWCLDVKGLTSADDETEEDGQMLKYDSSPRVIPLHPFLVEDLRFPEYAKKIEDKTRKKNGRLFPHLEKGEKTNWKYGHGLSTQFGYYLRQKVQITDRKKTLYSLRHNVADHLYNKMVLETVIEELEGRAGKTQTRRRYAKGYRAPVLYEEAILKLEYSVDLSHLKNSKYVVK